MDVSIWPGTRVLVFDTRLYRDDRSTPLAQTMQPATVLKRYGYRSRHNPSWTHPDVVDVRFDRDGRESCGHFTSYVRVIGGIS